MKLLGKIVVILMAALLVAGGTLALENSGALSSLTAGAGPGGEGRGEWDGDGTADADSPFAAGERPERGEFPGGGRGGEGGNWSSSLLGMARNLALIAAVIAGVGLLGWLSRQAATRRKLAKAEIPPDKEVISLSEKELP